ncbi:Ger(x)C family spore germination protein [Paenibacillus sp.]|uniref:Ger(x)C family spore germination protein n=1 Tax=Paenibacillus sp. TaxID=58172 RepID=UPI0028119A12|nr:Ger(x)C family spore germination protein [Paenibacillus sp.]
MKLYRIAMIALCLLLLSGCWSRRELNDILIVLGVGLDREDGEYLVSFQVVNPSEISSQKQTGRRSPGTLYQGRGKTIFEAARSVTTEAPRKMYFGHLQLYVVGESVAKEGLSSFIDNVLRDNELRMDFNLVVARGTKAGNVLKLYTPVEELPTNSMLQSLRTSEKAWAPSVSITMDEVLDRLSGDGHELALTGIQLIGESESGDSPKNVESFRTPSRYRYRGIAVFREDRLVGWLNEEESKGYTDITDRLDSTSIELACGDNRYIGIEVLNSKSKMKSEIKNGLPVMTVTLRTEAAIVDNQCQDVDVADPETIRKLEARAARVMQSNAEAAVKRAKELKSDVLGFGDQIAKEHPAFWKRAKKGWNEEYFPVVDVRYEIRLYIRRTGTTGNSTLDQ